MNSEMGEVVHERLQAFLDYSSKEDTPSDEGWRLFNEFVEAANAMAADYESSGAAHRGEPEPETAPEKERRVDAPHDNWFVEYFDGINQDMWDRWPGDKLTFRQKLDIFGQIFTVLFVIGLIVTLIVYMGMNGEEWEVDPTR